MMDKALTKTIPIVCPLLADPERLGLIKSDARPGGNVTGLLEWVEGLPGKHLELVHDLIPSVTKIGLVVNLENVHSLIHTLAPVRSARRPAGRPRQRPDAESFDGEVSF